MSDPTPDGTAQSFLDENFADWVRALAPRVTAAGPEGVTLDAPITPAIARVGGIVSGQALATLADTTMVLAVCAATGAFRPVATVSLETQFLRPATGDRITVTATVTRAGRTLAFARATLVAQPSGKAVATASATFALPD